MNPTAGPTRMSGRSRPSPFPATALRLPLASVGADRRRRPPSGQSFGGSQVFCMFGFSWLFANSPNLVCGRFRFSGTPVSLPHQPEARARRPAQEPHPSLALRAGVRGRGRRSGGSPEPIPSVPGGGRIWAGQNGGKMGANRAPVGDRVSSMGRRRRAGVASRRAGEGEAAASRRRRPKTVYDVAFFGQAVPVRFSGRYCSQKPAPTPPNPRTTGTRTERTPPRLSPTPEPRRATATTLPLDTTNPNARVDRGLGARASTLRPPTPRPARPDSHSTWPGNCGSVMDCSHEASHSSAPGVEDSHREVVQGLLKDGPASVPRDPSRSNRRGRPSALPWSG